MSRRLFYLLTALCGIVGVVALITSFIINEGPPAGASVPQIIVWGKQNVTPVLLGSWLQGTGSLLSVVFAFALVRLANATMWLSGWITMLAGTIVLVVSLTEVTFYLSALYSILNNDPGSVSISFILITAIQHMYFIAPALLLPLGIVILNSRILPLVFGYLALLVGVAFEVLGLLGLFIPFKVTTIVLPNLVGLWFLAAAIMILIRSRTIAGTEALSKQSVLAKT